MKIVLQYAHEVVLLVVRMAPDLGHSVPEGGGKFLLAEIATRVHGGHELKVRVRGYVRVLVGVL